MNAILLKALKKSIRKDRSSVQKEIARDLLNDKPLIRSLYEKMDATKQVYWVIFLVQSYAILNCLKINFGPLQQESVVGYSPVKNRKQILFNFLQKKDPTQSIKFYKTSWTHLFSLNSVSRLCSLIVFSIVKRRKLNNIIRHLLRTEELFVVIRATQLLFFYTIARPAVYQEKSPEILIASDSFHESILLALLFQSQGKKASLICHSPALPPIMANLNWDYVYTPGQQALDILVKNGCQIKETEFSIHQAPAAFAQSKLSDSNYLVLLGKCPNWQNLETLVNFLLNDLKCAQVTLKPHPTYSNLSAIGPLLKRVTLYKAGNSLTDYDFAVCGNSAAHLDCLLLGLPSYYWTELDDLSFDFYGLCHNNVVYQLNELSIEAFKMGQPFYQHYDYRKLKSYVNYMEPDRN